MRIYLTIFILFSPIICLYPQGVFEIQRAQTTETYQDAFFINDYVGWVVGWNGVILKTTNAGMSWFTQNSETDFDLYSVQFVNENVGLIVGHKYYNGYSSVILFTTNSGITWKQIFCEIENAQNGFIFDENNFWVCGMNTVFQTTDRGLTWHERFRKDSYTFYSIEFIDPNTGWVGGGRGSQIYATKDGGKTWALQYDFPGDFPTVNSIDFVDKNIGYSASFISVLKTTNGGTSWTECYSNNYALIEDVSFYDNLNGFAVDDVGNIIHTTNGGITWQLFMPGTGGYMGGVHYYSKNQCAAVGYIDFPPEYSLGTILKWDGTKESGKVFGTVSEDDSPGRQALVMAYQDDKIISLSVVDDNGNYSLNYLPLGNYEVRVKHYPCIPLRSVEILFYDSFKSLNIDFELVSKTNTYDSNPTSIFVTSRSRLENLFPNRDFNDDWIRDDDQMISYLHKISKLDEVRGRVVMIDENGINFPTSGQPESWLQVNDANNIAKKISDLIKPMIKKKTKYIILIGSDEIIPYYRVKDESFSGLPNYQESDYINNNRVAILSNNSLLALNNALDQNYFLTDNYYGCINPSYPYLPSLSVSRLVEDPYYIYSQIKDYINNGFDLNINYGVHASSLFDSDILAEKSKNLWNTIFTDNTLYTTRITDNWTISDLTNSLKKNGNYYLLMAGHSNHAGYSSKNTNDGLFYDGLAQTNIKNSLIIGAGCHMGLNIPNDVFSNEGVCDFYFEDFAEYFLKDGVVSYLAPTGFTRSASSLQLLDNYGSLVKYYLENLIKGNSVGTSLLNAKKEYKQSWFGIMTKLNEKTLMISQLYGLPFYKLKNYGNSEILAKNSALSPDTKNPVESIFTIKIPKPIEYMNDDIFYYMSPDSNYSMNYGLPLLPISSLLLDSLPNDKDLRGISLIDAKYNIIQLSNGIAVAQGGQFFNFDQPPLLTYSEDKWYPDVPYQVNKIFGEEEYEYKILVSSIQYNAAKNLVKVFDEMTFKLFYTDTSISDYTAPEFLNMSYLPNLPTTTDAINFSIEVNDSSGLSFVYFYYSIDNRLTWTNLPCRYSEGLWTATIDSILSEKIEFYFLAQDIYGNQSNTIINDSVFSIKLEGEVAPLIYFSPLISEQSQDSITFKATITDKDNNLNKDAVYLNFKINQGDWNMESMSEADIDLYSKVLKGLSGGDTVKYFISASDLSNNRSTYPNNIEETNLLWFYVNTLSSAEDVNFPDTYWISQNYPNPFNPSTKIIYQIPQKSKVYLNVYDILGREVALLVNEEKTQGKYEVTFNASKYASGVYFYKIIAGDYVASRKMILLK